jgi:D-xylose transport system ATP-binding protein
VLPPGSAWIVELRGIDKRFGAVLALGSVDFECAAGEIVGLVGDNGAGKSTLVKVVSGALPPDAGQIFFEGRAVTVSGPADAARLGIATVHQDLALCPNLDVVANLFLAREVTSAGAAGLLRRLEEIPMERQAGAVLTRLGTPMPNLRSSVAALSGGQRQSVAVARALLGSPRLVVLDEPTAALGVAAAAEVLDLVRRLRDHGLGVILVSHNLGQVFAVSDRIVVLRLGRRVATFRTTDSAPDVVVAAMTGSTLQQEIGA